MKITINRRNNVVPGDIVEYQTYGIDSEGTPVLFDYEPQTFFGVAEYVQDILIIKNTHIRIDRMFETEKQAEHGIGALFIVATREAEYDDNTMYWKILNARKVAKCKTNYEMNICKLFMNERGRIWFMTKDNQAVIIHAGSGNVMSKTVMNCLKRSKGMPEREGDMYEIDIDVDRLKKKLRVEQK